MTRHELINFINTNQSNWTAGDNFPEITSTEVLKRLNGVLGIDPDPEYQVTLRRHKIGKTKMPEFFDARDAWAECSGVIGYVRDQGQCGSCWVRKDVVWSSRGSKQMTVIPIVYKFLI
jgi:C1A family cysteine protease